MGTQWHRHRWLINVAIAFAYAMAYVAIRPFSTAHWALTSGLRLACLLTIPYRYWPALVLGEIGPLGYTNFACLEQFGWAWVVSATFPPVATAMPFVWFSRRHLKIFPAQRTLDMAALLTCTLSVSLMWALLSYCCVLVARVPADSPVQVSPMMIAGFLLGNYIAALTVVPWVLFAKFARQSMAIRELSQKVVRSQITHATALLPLPLLVGLTEINLHASSEGKDIVDYLMFLPVVWLTLLYGWRGAVAGAPLAVSALCLVLQDRPDPGIIQTQMFMAFALTTLFVMGAAISARKKDDDLSRKELSEARRVALHCLEINEQRLRNASQSLEQTVGMINAQDNRLLERVWALLPPNEGHLFYKQAANTQSHIAQLAERLHPVAWRQRGLPAALNDTIGRALADAGVSYQCEIDGRQVSRLASSVHATLFRLACESVAYVSSCTECNDVRLLIRGGVTGNNRWVVMRIAGSQLKTRSENLVYLRYAREGISEKLGATGLDLASLENQVRLFGGVLHKKSNKTKITLTLLLHDPKPVVRELGADATPKRLWVS